MGNRKQSQESGAAQGLLDGTMSAQSVAVEKAAQHLAESKLRLELCKEQVADAEGHLVKTMKDQGMHTYIRQNMIVRLEEKSSLKPVVKML